MGAYSYTKKPSVKQEAFYFVSRCDYPESRHPGVLPSLWVHFLNVYPIPLSTATRLYNEVLLLWELIQIAYPTYLVMHFREATALDTAKITTLYKAVAREAGGIARAEDEIDEQYVNHFLSRSIASGLIIVCENETNPGELIAEIHAYKSGIAAFDHVLTDLALVVHPAFQGRKVGRTIFAIFLEEIARNRRDVCKVELITRESNTRAISLYQSLGFKIEGRMEMRIKTPYHTYEADIPMGWENPNYEF